MTKITIDIPQSLLDLIDKQNNDYNKPMTMEDNVSLCLSFGVAQIDCLDNNLQNSKDYVDWQSNLRQKNEECCKSGLTEACIARDAKESQ